MAGNKYYLIQRLHNLSKTIQSVLDRFADDLFKSKDTAAQMLGVSRKELKTLHPELHEVVETNH